MIVLETDLPFAQDRCSLAVRHERRP